MVGSANLVDAPTGSAPSVTGRRIAIIGSGGAGKSTFAQALSQRLDLPVIHLDPIFWRPGWVEMPPAEWRARQEAMVREEAWIIDGTHAPTLDVRLGAADTVVLLDLNRFVCTWRVIKRRFRYGRRFRFDRAPGCDERLDANFVRWVWTYPSRGRPEALAAIADHAPDATLVRLTTRRAVKQFLSDLQTRPAAPRREVALEAC